MTSLHIAPHTDSDKLDMAEIDKLEWVYLKSYTPQKPRQSKSVKKFWKEMDRIRNHD